MVRHVGRSGKHRTTRPASHRGKSGWAPWHERKRRRENGELVAIKQEMSDSGKSRVKKPIMNKVPLPATPVVKQQSVPPPVVMQ